MLAKEPPPPQQQQELFIDGPSQQRGDQYVACESRKRASDNSLQFDRVMEVSKVAQPHKKKLHGTALFRKKGYFEE